MKDYIDADLKCPTCKESGSFLIDEAKLCVFCACGEFMFWTSEKDFNWATHAQKFRADSQDIQTKLKLLNKPAILWNDLNFIEVKGGLCNGK
jgi:hypothetical protein